MHSAAYLVAVLLTSAAPPAETLKQYADAASTVGHSPEANLKLALWCEEHGLEPERERHLAMVIVADPENAVARGLLGQVKDEGKWRNPAAVAERVQSDRAMVAILKEYAGRRDETPKSAVEQYKLALWCEKQGLKSEATAHLTSVVRLEPNSEQARKRLGYKKRDGQWLTDEQIAASKHTIALQRSADAHWKPILTKARRDLSNRDERAKAERELGSITDPHAVPMILSLLGKKEPLQTLQLLGQIDSAESSRALSLLATFNHSPELRRVATETLRSRDPREWAGALISLLADPISYEFKRGTGPDGADELFIEGERFDRKRIYKSPKAVDLQKTDQFVGLDGNGLPIFVRTIGQWQSPLCEIGDDPNADAILRTKQSIKFALAAELSMGASMATYAYPELTGPTLAQRQNFVQNTGNALGGAVGHGDGPATRQPRQPLTAGDAI